MFNSELEINAFLYNELEVLQTSERLSSRLGERASVMLTASVEVGQILKEELSISMDDTVPSFFWGCARYRAHERYNHDRAVFISLSLNRW